MNTKHLIINLTIFTAILFTPLIGNSGTKYLQNGNGIVIDTTTSLLWQQGFSLGHDWDSAADYCKQITLGEHSDWRLPTLKELGSIVDPGKRNPAIDSRSFNASSDRYWTSSIEGSTEAWLVFFDSGLSGYDLKSRNQSVRCVRNK